MIGIALRWLTGGFSGVLHVIRTYPLQCALIAALCLAGWLWRGKSQAIGERDAEVAAHVATKASYRQAQADAARLDAERLARVEADQERINDDTSESYRRRIAELDARVARLRAQGRAGAGSAANRVAVSGDAAASGGIASPSGDALSALALAEAQAVQLDELITWNFRQAGVPVD